EALTAANRMALPRYQGADESTQIQPYLREAYRVYLSKMHEIGLAGATLNYDKFTFLFDDLRSKGLDFTERFETMYTYLKQDKKRMGVSEKLQMDESLQISDCADLSDDFMVCSRAGRNYLFVAGSYRFWRCPFFKGSLFELRACLHPAHDVGCRPFLTTSHQLSFISSCLG